MWVRDVVEVVEIIIEVDVVRLKVAVDARTSSRS